MLVYLNVIKQIYCSKVCQVKYFFTSKNMEGERSVSYQPKPIDTSSIKLSVEIQELQEKLAENIHEIWSLQRIQEGWTYGPERNDQKKEHPNLIPYDQLTEEEKDYDRNTAMETLKTIVSLGYKISK